MITADLGTHSGDPQLLSVVGQLHPSLQDRVKDMCVELPLHYCVPPQSQVAHVTSDLLAQLPVLAENKLLVGLQRVPLP